MVMTATGSRMHSVGASDHPHHSHHRSAPLNHHDWAEAAAAQMEPTPRSTMARSAL